VSVRSFIIIIIMIIFCFAYISKGCGVELEDGTTFTTCDACGKFVIESVEKKWKVNEVLEDVGFQFISQESVSVAEASSLRTAASSRKATILGLGEQSLESWRELEQLIDE
jgi:hypothetical protein